MLICKVARILEAVSGFTNPFSSCFEDNELHFLSFDVPAKPGKAKDLIEAGDIGRKVVADFIDSLLVENLSMLWLFVGPTGVYLLGFFCSSLIYC